MRIGPSVARLAAVLAVLAVPAVSAVVACSSDTPAPAPVDAGPDGPPDTGTPAVTAPGSIDLGKIGCGGTGTGTLELKNTGDGALTFTAAAGSAITVTPAQGTIAPGASATLTLAVTLPSSAEPGAVQTVAAQITTNAPGTPSITVQATVTATGGKIENVPATLDFGLVGVGDSKALPLTIKNTGDAKITVKLAPSPNTVFVPSWPAQPIGALLNPGDTMTGAQVTFSPTQEGGATGSTSLIIADPLCGTIPPNPLSLTGTGAVAVDAGSPVDADSDSQ